MTVLLSIVALALIGAPLFVLIGAAISVAFWQYGPPEDFFMLGGRVLGPFEGLLKRDPFLAIPLFVGTGALMTEGGTARRLIAFMRALLGWLPGGLGMSAVVACMGFAAISGSSPVTLIAVGSIMFPAMVKGRYPENFSLGLVMTAGSLGCLVAPSLILTIYALAVSASDTAVVSTEQMWMGAYVPATALMLILCGYCFVVGLKHGEREPFSARKLWDAARDGVWALALPFVVFFGIREGFFAPFKAGAVAFTYALIVTVFIHREINLTKLIKTLSDAARLMGMLILIIGMTFSLNQLFTLLDVQAKLVALLTEWDLGPVGFLILVNIFLILIGALMDSVSATLVFAPILAPIAVGHYCIDPVHFGIVFVVNMEIGYLAPPVATNLFVASALFKKPFGQVSRAVLPGLGITTAALFLFMFVPTCSKGLTNLQDHGAGQVWQSFPWDGDDQVKGGTCAALSDDGKTNVGGATRKSAEDAIKDDHINEATDEEIYGISEDDAGVDDEADGGATAVEVIQDAGVKIDASDIDASIDDVQL